LPDLKQKISRLPLIITLINWSKKYALPGFDNVPIYYIIRFIFEELKKDNINTRADAVAFNFFLSIFPLSIFILPLIANSPFGINYLNILRESIKGVLPINAESYIFNMVNDIQREGQFGVLSIGFFLALFFASNGMSKLMKGFDKTHNSTFKSRGYIKTRAVAILLTFLLSILTFFSIVLIILSKQLLGFLSSTFDWTSGSEFGFHVLRWTVIILLFYSVITSIYRFGPSMYQKIKFFSPGASLATVSSIFSSVLFSYFINQFSRHNEIYGSIGALIVILVWLRINAFILLSGFELNTSIAVNRDLGRVKG